MAVTEKLAKQQQLSQITNDIQSTDLNTTTLTNNNDDIILVSTEEEKQNDGFHKRTYTMHFGEKFECWMSMDIHLVDILLQQELFVIRSWLVILWRDNKSNEFKQLFDKNTLSTLEKKGFISYSDLNI
eukprot:153685_1